MQNKAEKHDRTKRKQLADVLRSYRKENKKTQIELAALMGGVYDDKVISNYESSRNTPDADFLNAFADVLNLHPTERAALLDLREQIINPLPDFQPREAIKQCEERLQATNAPALVIDQFYDIIAVNASLAAFLSLDEFYPPLDKWNEQEDPINLLDLLLAIPTESLASITDKSAPIRQEIERFRASALPWRYWPYYPPLVERLIRQHRRFYDEWHRPHSDGQNGEGQAIRFYAQNPLHVPEHTVKHPWAKRLETIAIGSFILGFVLSFCALLLLPLVWISILFFLVALISILISWLFREKKVEAKYDPYAEFPASCTAFPTTQGTLQLITYSPDNEKAYGNTEELLSQMFPDLPEDKIIRTSNVKNHS